MFFPRGLCVVGGGVTLDTLLVLEVCIVNDLAFLLTARILIFKVSYFLFRLDLYVYYVHDVNK